MKISVGDRLRSQIDATELVVVRAGSEDVDLRCGGAELIELDADPAPDPDLISVPAGEPPQLGKRYADESGSLELLVTKADGGVLSLGGDPLVLRQAKPMPASD